MPLYAYRGIAQSGKTAQGVREADSPKTLRQLLRKDGITVTQVELSKGGKGTAAAGKGLNREVDFGRLLSRVKRTEVAAFTRQLATLLRAGIPLAESMGALFDQTENQKFKSVIGEVRTAVNEGAALADAVEKHPAVFDELFVSMVRAGELAGNLDDVLARLADFMESSQQLKSKVQGAMVYPIIMIVVGTLIMSILMIAVVPKITTLFVQQKKALPWNTELLILISDVLGGYWWLVGSLLILAGILLRRWIRTSEGQKRWHGWLLRMPLMGAVLRKVAVARFARTLGTMLNAGVPLLRALDTAKEVLGNVVLQGAVENAKHAVSEGQSLAETLRRSKQFPPAITHMIAVGERAGELESMLLRVADAYEREVDMTLSRMTTVLEPLMLVVMGGAVAFVVFSILMPIMDMQQFPGS